MKPYGYDFDRLVYEKMTAHEQEVFITRFATAQDLQNIAFYYPAADTFALVAHRDDDKSSRIIAGSPITSPSTLGYLWHSQSRNVYVLRPLAQNENTPEWVLSALVSPHSPDKTARIYAWRNPSLSPDDRTSENDPMGNN